MQRTFGRRSTDVAPRPVETSIPTHVPDLDTDAVMRRLRRVTAMPDAEPPVATSQPQSASIDCGLSTSAFALLRVSLDADDAAIARAYDDLSFEPDADEAALSASRAQLSSARGRLVEELAWLPELDNAQQAEARTALAKGDIATLTRLRNAASGLARINLTLAVAADDNLDDMLGLFIDVRNWNPDVTLDALDEARGRARSRPVDETHFRALVAGRFEDWAKRVIPGFSTSREGRARLVRLMLSLGDAQGEQRTKWLDAVLRAYSAAVDDLLASTHNRLRAQIDRLEVNPADQAAATSLLSSLDLWTTYRQPIQVVEAARNLDDPASADLLQAVRSLSIQLSDHNQDALVLRLNQALIQCARYVPTILAKLEADLTVVEHNALYAQVRQCCERALAEPRQFSHNVMQGALMGKATGRANELASAFARALELWHGDPSPLFQTVRAMVVELHNEASQTASTPVLINWLLALDPPIEIAVQLRADMRAVTAQSTQGAAGSPNAKRGGIGLGAVAVASVLLGLS